MTKTNSRTVKLMLLLIVTVVIASAIYFKTRSRLVLYKKAVDGTEIGIYQLSNPLEFSLETIFIYRVHGGNWRCYYYDHEDSAWKDVNVDMDEDHTTITIYRSGQPNIRFNWGSNVFERYGEKGFVADASPSDDFSSSYGRSIREQVLEAIEKRQSDD